MPRRSSPRRHGQRAVSSRTQHYRTAVTITAGKIHTSRARRCYKDGGTQQAAVGGAARKLCGNVMIWNEVAEQAKVSMYGGVGGICARARRRHTRGGREQSRKLLQRHAHIYSRRRRTRSATAALPRHAPSRHAMPYHVTFTIIPNILPLSSSRRHAMSPCAHASFARCAINNTPTNHAIPRAAMPRPPCFCRLPLRRRHVMPLPRVCCVVVTSSKLSRGKQRKETKRHAAKEHMLLRTRARRARHMLLCH